MDGKTTGKGDMIASSSSSLGSAGLDLAREKGWKSNAEEEGGGYIS